MQTPVPGSMTESKQVVELDGTEREPAVESDWNRTAILRTQQRARYVPL